jgi:hypothetical protein
VGAVAGFVLLAVPGRAVDAQGVTDTLVAPTAQIIALLRAQVFTDNGRYYPCRNIPSCSSWGQNLAVSDPKITVDGPRLVVQVHLVGSYAMNAYLAPQVAGDLILSGVPVTHGTRVSLDQPSVQTGAADFTFQTFIQATHTRIEQMISESGGFDLAQYLSDASRNPQLPPPRIPGAQCLDPSEIRIRSVATDPAASAIDAVVIAPIPKRRAC